MAKEVCPVPPLSAAIAVALQVPEERVPTEVKDDAVTPDPKVLLDKTSVPSTLKTFPDATLRSFLTVVVPLVAPMEMVVADCPIFKVVVVAFIRLKVVWDVVMSPPFTAISPLKVMPTKVGEAVV